MRKLVMAAVLALAGTAWAQGSPSARGDANNRVSGQKYDTRGPGAGKIAEKAVSMGQSVNISGGHVPTLEELAKGAPPDLVDPGPIPRPQLGGEGAGM